jgi:uncharacterized protein YbjQ (UPF0145 family)
LATIKQKSNDDWRAKRSQEQLALGGLPLNAEWRLRRLTESRHLSTSFFSVNELALTASVGVRPLGQVIGSSSFHVGIRPQPYLSSMELTALSQVQNQVRRLALSRLLQEAQALGARAVLGVRLETRTGIGGNALLEISASGTAVDWHEARPPLDPILCGLSGQDFCTLRQSGYRPVGLVLGTCVYYQIGSANTTWATGNALLSGTARMNQELTDYTEGFYQARHRAVGHLEDETWYAQAEGVVGLTMEKTLETREVELEIYERKVRRRDLIVSICLLGTAIAPFADRTPPVFAVMPLGGA